ncbi:UvrD-helicase domain-containing protein [Streptomyces sp. SID12501]|uniref:UvrD-helicase domain-containing protein n=1 Tax=Streptomyces sp. SID12501 TaxID=2706042 RepID=A0A6B3C520_9ACTN|nr:UvrD-helicase domain-containing protein [Streptomyces sp. SID12501]
MGKESACTSHCDWVLLDEAQDTNPVLEQVFTAQRGHAQLMMVGDCAQAVYGWRGAHDAMTGFDGTALTLTQSFRFGPRLAVEANRWLAIAGAPIRLDGTDTISTELGPVVSPAAVLCRTDVGAMAEVMAHFATSHRVALAGGAGTLRALATAARDLTEGRRTWHPDSCSSSPGANCATVTVSAVHRAEGREWATVEIADDFTPSDDSDGNDVNGRPLPGPIDDAEAPVAYIAVTRARHRLDLGGLSWIRHPGGNPCVTPPEPRGGRSARTAHRGTRARHPRMSDVIGSGLLVNQVRSLSRC